jgi:polysaccharide export outer membrane protein
MPVSSGAQATPGPRPNFESRAELETELQRLESSDQQSEAVLIRERLQNGDFQEGDRIAVIVKGAAGFQDTLLVRSGRRLQLPNVADLSLEGVLRSELVPRLSAHLKQFLRDPEVQAIPLVRVGVLGRVANPGYYHTAADIPLSDVLMAAGGPTPEADLNKISVRRGATIILNEQKTRTALTEGRSLDQMHLRAGDEVMVGEQRRINWGVIIPVVSGLLTVILAVAQLGN